MTDLPRAAGPGEDGRDGGGADGDVPEVELGADLPELDAAGTERIRGLLRGAAAGPMPADVVARLDAALARARAELAEEAREAEATREHEAPVVSLQERRLARATAGAARCRWRPRWS